MAGPEGESAGGPPIACSTCGALAAADDASALLTWSRGTEGGRVVWSCPDCTRTHSRAIEGKLDSAWW